MTKTNLLTQFAIVFIISLAVAFAIHISILNGQGLPKFDNLIVFSYIFNFILGSFIFGALFLLRNRLKNQIGFLFIAGSFLKFLLFFILFYPTYREDGDLTFLEFAAFFIPYVICLTLETIYTSKMLNKMK